MNWLNIVAAPITGIAKAVIDSRNRKRELNQAIHIKRLERVEQGQIAEVQWNMKAKATSGWIDDYLTIVLSLPLILSFFPSLVPHIAEGFKALDATPVWYRAAIAVMISAGFGYKKYADTQMAKHYTLPTLAGGD